LNGGELLHLAVAGCVSNDLFREAAHRGIALTRVAVRIQASPAIPPCRSGITYDVEVEGDAPAEDLDALVASSTRRPKSPTRCGAARPWSCGLPTRRSGRATDHREVATPDP